MLGDQTVFYWCHLTSDDIVQTIRRRIESASDYPRVAPITKEHMRECFEAIGRTREEAEANARAFRDEYQRRSHS
jgi:hypothetical protein